MKKNAYARIIVILMSASALMFHLQCTKAEMNPEPEVESAPPPEVDFSIVSNLDGMVTLIINGDNWNLWSITWDFGDGPDPYPSVVLQKSHQYFNKGDYDIVMHMVLKSNDAIQRSKTQRVSVDPTWERVGKLPFKMEQCCFFTTANGIFVMVSDESLNQKNTVWQMDTTKGTWSKKWDAPFKTYGLQSAVSGDQVYFGCGWWDPSLKWQHVQTFWVLDIPSGNWSFIPLLTQPDSSRTSFCASDGQLFAMKVQYWGASGELWKFDPGQNTWTMESIFTGDGQGVFIDRLVSLNNHLYLWNRPKLWKYQEDSKIWEDLGEADVDELNGIVLLDDAQNALYVGGIPLGSSFGPNPNSGGGGNGSGDGFDFEFCFWCRAKSPGDGMGGDVSSADDRGGDSEYYAVFNTDTRMWGEKRPQPSDTYYSFFFNNVQYFITGSYNVLKYSP